MIRPLRWLALTLTALGVAAGSAAAQDAFIAAEPQYLMNLGVGGGVKPTYPGADKYMFVPYPIIEFGRMYLPIIGQTEKKTRGVFVYPSFGLNGKREASDDGSLKGTREVDWAFEAGLGGGFQYDWFRAFATARQGFNGYSGQTGELGFDILLPMGSRFDFAFGPRTSWGSESYMETYFGVTQQEAAKGTLAAYKPDAGFKSAGLAGQVNYWIDDRTRLQVKGSWSRLIDDAGDSPIVKAGSRDQWTFGIGISRKLQFNLFR